ncbi:MAG: hypothetical protein ACYC1K_00255 [Minisyncoccota bacterium]
MTVAECATIISGGLTETGHGVPVPRSFDFLFSDWNRNKNVISITTLSSDNVDEIIDFLQTNNIKIYDCSEIRDFLVNHTYIIEHLYNIPSKISEYFGKADIKLSLFKDFDSEIKDTELFVEIKTSLSPQEANDKLTKIHREWFLPLGMNLDKLNISLNFF